MTATVDQTYVIRVGPLNSLSSLIFFLSRPLAELSQMYVRGQAVRPVFDLRAVEPRRQSMAALTAFLSIAERLGKFTGYPVPVLFDWNPAVLSFWDDIKFLQLAETQAYLQFEEALLGGYRVGATNPNTRIVRYALDETDPMPDLRSGAPLRAWKDRTRSMLSNDISFTCENLFRPIGSRGAIDERVKNLITASAAELALNSLMHGRAPAYLGVQRAPASITVAVCDCGEGFPRSLSRHPNHADAINRSPPSDAQALLFACLMNRSEMGLLRAITQITGSSLFDGAVLMSSYSAEMRWRQGLWERTLKALDDKVTRPADLDVSALLGPSLGGRPSYEAKQEGFYRSWEPGLRGTRVSFEIRIHTDHA